MTRKEFLDQYLLDNNLTLEEFRAGFVVLKTLDDGYEAVAKGEQTTFVKARRVEGMKVAEIAVEETPTE